MATKTKATDKKPSKPKAKKPTKAERQSEAEELLGRIEKAVELADAVQTELAERKESYKRQKGVLENCRKEVAKLVRARKEKRPLFDQKPAATNGEKSAEAQTASAQPSVPVDPGTDGDWKSLGIVRLGLNAKRTQQLVDAGLLTLGQLQQHQNDQGQWWGNGIKGLGEKGQEEVSDAWIAFWKAHPEFCRPTMTVETKIAELASA